MSKYIELDEAISIINNGGPAGNGADLISRADAIDAVIAQRHKAELSDYNFALGLAEDAIRHLPSAEADMSEYADRLWKIAYERGKREASADAVSREALNGVKFVAIKGDKVEEAYRSGWNSAIECIIENAPSAEVRHVGDIKKVYDGCYCHICGRPIKTSGYVFDDDFVESEVKE